MYTKPEATTWTAVDSKDNAVATAAKPADSRGRQHLVTGVLASYSASCTGLLQIKDGDAVIATLYVTDSAVIPFVQPLRGSPGNAVSAVLAASGTAGVVGAVTMIGYTD